jgi:hypothetical protein
MMQFVKKFLTVTLFYDHMSELKKFNIFNGFLETMSL